MVYNQGWFHICHLLCFLYVAAIFASVLQPNLKKLIFFVNTGGVHGPNWERRRQAVMGVLCEYGVTVKGFAMGWFSIKVFALFGYNPTHGSCRNFAKG